MFALPDVFPITDPTWIMCCVLCLILGAPLLFERLRVPPLVGMVLAGVLVGPFGLGILERDDSFGIFGQVGLYYIMFTAGLSMDTTALKSHRLQVVSFGLLSFGIPFLMGYGASFWLLGMSEAASILIACILASHTMVAFSIASRYGLAHHRGVTLSVVATMISLVLSLFILAALSASFEGDSGVMSWLLIVLKCGLYTTLVLIVYPKVIRFVFRRLSDDVLQYIFVMCMVLLSAAVCDSLGLEGVLGAFLAGLVFNRYIPDAAPLMKHIDFVGNALFIPYFLIGVGMLIDVRLLVAGSDALVVTAVIVVVALVSKCLAAVVMSSLFRLDSNCRGMMMGLTSAHAAGGLAIVMVGRRLLLPSGEPLVDEMLLNAVIMLILFSCVFSAYVTSSAARRISLNEVSDDEQTGVEDKMLVALSRSESMCNLITAAILMRPHRSNTPLVGVRLVVDDVGNERELSAARQMVNDAAVVAASASVNLKKVVRSSVNPITGLSHLMKDFETSEILMGYHLTGGKAAKSFGNITSEMLATISRQIMILHTTRPLNTIRRIHVVVPFRADKEVGFVRWLNHVLRLGRQLD
ncbi:MAG: cation:proton antiporter, partial [Bacteroidaceae bacterium]|nr:cation:proton antiporter [Bacteroidaceae bacterium]